MKHYAGIDLHCNNCYVVISDERGRVVSRGRVVNELGAVLRMLEPYRETLLGVAVESTYNWYWLADGLGEAGYPVRLAHVAAVEKYKEGKHQNDATDAFLLTDLMRIDKLPTGYIYPKETRGLRDLLRQRSRLVRSRSANLQSVGTIFARTLGRRVLRDDLYQFSEEEIVGCLGDPNISDAALAAVRVIQCQSEQILQLEEKALAQVKDDGEFRMLQTISGVGQILGMTIWLETGDIGRFGSVGDYASYSRCVASDKYSNGRRKGEGNRKNGNGYLCWAFMEAGHFADRFDARARGFRKRKERQAHPRLAWKALAHKLSRAAYYVMRDGVPFQPAKLFGN